MKILVIGSGGREHAIIRRLAQDSIQHDLHAAPGNPGMANHATLHPIEVTDHAGITRLALDLRAELVVIGPEVPLVAGLSDVLTEASITVFGPSASAAELEGSKDFAKQLMLDAKIPTAKFITLEAGADIEAALTEINPGGSNPYVVKADGLAAGKGVVVTNDLSQAVAHARACLAEENAKVVIEEYLAGPELSVFCICDGSEVVPLSPAQDFKRVWRADEGPNTGGMGSYTPLPWLDEKLVMEKTVSEIAKPTLAAMKEMGREFKGVLFCGLVATKEGLKVIEFNVRFGDPETQVVLNRLKSDLAPLLTAAASGRLAELPALEWHEQASVCVVLASEGYPLTSRSGDEIAGVNEVEDEFTHVIHAGTKVSSSGALIADGGRVLSVVSSADDLEQARVRAQSAIARITLAGSHYRTDIAELAASGQLPKIEV